MKGAVCLTIRDPWLWAIVHADKRIENRSWSTRYRGPLYLHAATKLASRDEQRACWEILGEPFIELKTSPGHIVALAQLLDCVQLPDDQLGRWGVPGAWHWLLGDVRPLPLPIPARGALGLWRLAD